MKQAPVLSEVDTRRVLQHVAKTAYAKRNRCMMMLSWLAGMRCCEIAALRLGDVLTADGEVRTEIRLSASQTKGREGRTVLLNTQLRSEVEAYVKSLHAIDIAASLIRSKTGKRFSANGLCQLFLKLYDDAGLDRMTSHSGRRTFCTKLCEAGTSIHIVAALAGHRHIATTAVYLTANPNIMRKAVELA